MSFNIDFPADLKGDWSEWTTEANVTRIGTYKSLLLAELIGLASKSKSVLRRYDLKEAHNVTNVWQWIVIVNYEFMHTSTSAQIRLALISPQRIAD